MYVVGGGSYCNRSRRDGGKEKRGGRRGGDKQEQKKTIEIPYNKFAIVIGYLIGGLLFHVCDVEAAWLGVPELSVGDSGAFNFCSFLPPILLRIASTPNLFSHLDNSITVSPHPRHPRQNVGYASYVARRHQDRGLLRKRPQDGRGKSPIHLRPSLANHQPFSTRTSSPSARRATTINRPSTASSPSS